MKKIMRKKEILISWSIKNADSSGREEGISLRFLLSSEPRKHSQTERQKHSEHQPKKNKAWRNTLMENKGSAET